MIKRIFYVFTILVVFILIYVIYIKNPTNKEEKALLNFSSNGSVGDALFLSDIFPEMKKHKNIIFCIIFPYHTEVINKDKQHLISDEMYSKVNKSLKHKKYRHGTLGVLQSEGQLGFVFFSDSGVFDIVEISYYKVPIIWNDNQGDCFDFNRAFFEKTNEKNHSDSYFLKVSST